MSTTALGQAIGWAEALHDAEFRGRKDTDGAARQRLAEKLGVKENYLFRLQYRAQEMKDVAGEVYRRLQIAYENLCEANEKAADAYRAERLSLRAKRHEANRKSAASGGRETAALD
jgi:hypothetical protein